ncbi:MAG TPA: type II secretion system protein GspG [Acidobacteriota bacterium]|nr:type II secretion system protein GspG [Acidobacteriota bacterium]
MRYLHLTLLIGTILLVSCGKSLDKQVQEQVRTSANAELDAEAVEILSVRESGNQAIAEISVKTAVRMRKEGKHWVLDEVRLGDRRWEKVDRILAALEESRKAETLGQIDQIAHGIQKYVEDSGKVPQVMSYEELLDTLNPRYLPTVIRVDSWWKPFGYEPQGTAAFDLRSAGPDGEFHTDDDLVSK